MSTLAIFFFPMDNFCKTVSRVEIFMDTFKTTKIWY